MTTLTRNASEQYVRKVMSLATLGGITQIDGDGYANMLIAARQPRQSSAGLK